MFWLARLQTNFQSLTIQEECYLCHLAGLNFIYSIRVSCKTLYCITNKYSHHANILRLVCMICYSYKHPILCMHIFPKQNGRFNVSEAILHSFHIFIATNNFMVKLFVALFVLVGLFWLWHWTFPFICSQWFLIYSRILSGSIETQLNETNVVKCAKLSQMREKLWDWKRQISFQKIHAIVQNGRCGNLLKLKYNRQTECRKWIPTECVTYLFIYWFCAVLLFGWIASAMHCFFAGVF